MNVRIYIEGGGDQSGLRRQCREAFRTLFDQAGFKEGPLHLIACGGRGAAYRDFCIAVRQKKGYVVLLVDSEDLMIDTPWDHLRKRDGWARPDGVEDDQAQLMVTCMETLVMADREGLRKVFRNCLTEGSLLSETALETKAKRDVQESLEGATKSCGKDRKYEKGRRSFQVVEQLNPDTLKLRLPHFKRLLTTLGAKL